MCHPGEVGLPVQPLEGPSTASGYPVVPVNTEVGVSIGPM